MYMKYMDNLGGLQMQFGEGVISALQAWMQSKSKPNAWNQSYCITMDISSELQEYIVKEFYSFNKLSSFTWKRIAGNTKK